MDLNYIAILIDVLRYLEIYILFLAVKLKTLPFPERIK